MTGKELTDPHARAGGSSQSVWLMCLCARASLFDGQLQRNKRLQGKGRSLSPHTVNSLEALESRNRQKQKVGPSNGGSRDPVHSQWLLVEASIWFWLIGHWGLDTGTSELRGLGPGKLPPRPSRTVPTTRCFPRTLAAAVGAAPNLSISQWDGALTRHFQSFTSGPGSLFLL